MPVEKIVEKIAGAKPEKPLAPETKSEKPLAGVEKVPAASEKVAPISKPAEKVSAVRTAVVSQAQSYQAQRAQAIDNILSEGLNEIFLKMPAADQAAFKKKGEETVTKINFLLNQAKIKISKIVDLIRRWLKLIPGVNKFFLEQEAKIKADKIVRLKNR